MVIVTAGAIIGSEITALDDTLPERAVPYNSDALLSAIADGMSRAGAALVNADTGAAERRH